MHRGMFSSLPGLCLLHASSTDLFLSSRDNQNISRHCQIFTGGGGTKLPLVEKQCSKITKSSVSGFLIESSGELRNTNVGSHLRPTKAESSEANGAST